MTSLMLGALLALATSAAPGDGVAAFEAVKKLEGRWEGHTMTPDGPPGAVVFEVTGGGSAVRETMFPGTPHEMMNVYHLDGGELVVTHYCHGNQPRFKRDAKASTAAEIALSFEGGTNIDPATTGHMHAAKIRLVAPDRLEEDWTFHKGGKAVDTKKFFLSRTK